MISGFLLIPFLQLLLLPNPPFRPIYYTLVIIDLCKVIFRCFNSLIQMQLCLLVRFGINLQPSLTGCSLILQLIIQGVFGSQPQHAMPRRGSPQTCGGPFHHLRNHCSMVKILCLWHSMATNQTSP